MPRVRPRLSTALLDLPVHHGSLGLVHVSVPEPLTSRRAGPSVSITSRTLRSAVVILSPARKARGNSWKNSKPRLLHKTPPVDAFGLVHCFAPLEIQLPHFRSVSPSLPALIVPSIPRKLYCDIPDASIRTVRISCGLNGTSTVCGETCSSLRFASAALSIQAC